MKKIPDNQLIMFQALDGGITLEVLYEDNNVWLSQKKIAELYDTTPKNIIMHLKNIYKSGGMIEDSTCKNSLQVQNEGSRQVSRHIKLYSLEAIQDANYISDFDRELELLEKKLEKKGE